MLSNVDIVAQLTKEEYDLGIKYFGSIEDFCKFYNESLKTFQSFGITSNVVFPSASKYLNDMVVVMDKLKTYDLKEKCSLSGNKIEKLLTGIIKNKI